MSFADDLKAAGGENRAAVREIPAYRGEDELVLAVGAELLGIGARHHALDYLRRSPRLDVGEAVLREIRIAVRVRGDVDFLHSLFRRERGV